MSITAGLGADCVTDFSVFNNYPCIVRRPEVVQYIPTYDDVTTWKHFQHYRPFVRRIQQLLVDSPYRGSVMKRFEGNFAASLNKLLNKLSTLPVIWYVKTLMWRQCFDYNCRVIELFLSFFFFFFFLPWSDNYRFFIPPQSLNWNQGNHAISHGKDINRYGYASQMNPLNAMMV